MSTVRNMILDGVALENNRLGISSMETSMIRGDEAVEFERKKEKGVTIWIGWTAWKSSSD